MVEIYKFIVPEQFIDSVLFGFLFIQFQVGLLFMALHYGRHLFEGAIGGLLGAIGLTLHSIFDNVQLILEQTFKMLWALYDRVILKNIPTKRRSKDLLVAIYSETQDEQLRSILEKFVTQKGSISSKDIANAEDSVSKYIRSRNRTRALLNI